MFWSSVISALKVLTYWQTHVAILEYLSFFLVPGIVVCFFIKQRHEACMKYIRMILLPVLEACAAAVFILTLFPIILGMEEDALWAFPLKMMRLSPGGFLGLLGTLSILAVCLTFIPKVAKLQPFKTLVLGGVSLVFVQFFLNFINPVMDIQIMDLIPGFWFAAGVIFFAVALSKAGHFLLMFSTAFLGNRFNLREGAAEVLILPLTAILGFIPVFVYGAWLA